MFQILEAYLEFSKWNKILNKNKKLKTYYLMIKKLKRICNKSFSKNKVREYERKYHKKKRRRMEHMCTIIP